MEPRSGSCSYSVLCTPEKRNQQVHQRLQELHQQVAQEGVPQGTEEAVEVRHRNNWIPS